MVKDLLYTGIWNTAKIYQYNSEQKRFTEPLFLVIYWSVLFELIPVLEGDYLKIRFYFE